MNVKTNFYGAIALSSTIGKNGFAAGQTTSKVGENTFWGTRQVVEVNVLGCKVFENLETASKNIKEFDEQAKIKCQEWETWAEQKYEEAKREEDLNEDWRKFNNQPTKLEKAYNLAKKVGGKVNQLTSGFIGLAARKWKQFDTKFFRFYFC